VTRIDVGQEQRTLQISSGELSLLLFSKALYETTLLQQGIHFAFRPLATHLEEPLGGCQEPDTLLCMIEIGDTTYALGRYFRAGLWSGAEVPEWGVRPLKII
jgi:hypothetical protein